VGSRVTQGMRVGIVYDRRRLGTGWMGIRSGGGVGIRWNRSCELPAMESRSEGPIGKFQTRFGSDDTETRTTRAGVRISVSRSRSSHLLSLCVSGVSESSGSGEANVSRF